MHQRLEELPLADDLKQALLGASSPLRPVLEFVEHYERGDWTVCAELAMAHGIANAKTFDR